MLKYYYWSKGIYYIFWISSLILSITISSRSRFIFYLFRSSNGIVHRMVLRKIKIKVLRRYSTIGAQHAMCQHSVADVSRFNTEYNRVNSKTDAAKIKRRGVNCGYTDFTSSLLVRFTPTIYPCSDQPLILVFGAQREKMYEGEYRQQLSIENRVCALTKNRVERVYNNWLALCAVI